MVGPETTIVVNLELKNGNTGRSKHWSSASRDKKAFLRAIGEAVETWDVPVDITVTRVLAKGQRLWDADSVLRGNAKELIDTLVTRKYIVDDGPKYVKTCTGKQLVVDDRPESGYIIIDITAA